MPLASEIVVELRALVCYGIGLIASVTLRGLGAVGGTGCIFIGYVVGEGVAELRALVCYGIGLIASVTLRGLGAIGGTGCVFIGYVVGEGVAELGKYVCYIVVAAGTSVGGITFLGTLGRGYRCSIGVILLGLGDNHELVVLCIKVESAAGAGVVTYGTGGCTGCRSSLNPFTIVVNVIELGNDSTFCADMSANGTLEVANTGGLFGRREIYSPLVSMRSEILLITALTFIPVVIIVCAPLFSIGVSLCRSELNLTYGTDLGIGTRSLVAGSMSCCGSKLNLTYGTDLRVDTGCCLAGSMSRCGSELCLTYGTDLRIGTGCCLTGSMTERIAIGNSASVTGLGCIAICIKPVVAESFSLGSTAKSTGLGSLAGCVLPVMLAELKINRYCGISEYTCDLDLIRSESVLERGGNERRIFAQYDIVLGSYGKIEVAILA